MVNKLNRQIDSDWHVSQDTNDYETLIFDNRIEHHYNGLRHSDNSPAIEYFDGSRSWWENGQLHRIDGPAVELTNGTKVWYLNGELIKVKWFDEKL